MKTIPPWASMSPPAAEARTIRARQAREDLVRSGEIELGDTRIQREDDGELCSHAGLPASVCKSAAGVAVSRLHVAIRRDAAGS